MPKEPKAGRRIRQRLVLFFPGFEPLDGEAHYRRFARAAQMTGALWGASIETGPLTQTGSLAEFEIVSEGTQTHFVICDLARVMTVMSGRNFAARLGRGLFAQMTFIFNGTLFAYLRTSWRYGLFFLYPLVMLGLMAGASYAAGMFGGPLVGLALFAGLFWLAWRHAHLLLIMDLWHYARLLATGGGTEEIKGTEALVAAAELCALERIVKGGVDEIVIAGHSVGAALAVELTDRLAQRRLAATVNVLTLGSDYLQVALHPKAERFRNMGKRLISSGTHWLDVQALIDPINFLHSQLDRKFGIAALNYREIIVRMRHLLTPQTYNRIKFDMFRVHRQYVLPVEVRQGFSFHRIVTGPAAFSAIVSAGGLPESDTKQGSLHDTTSA